MSFHVRRKDREITDCEELRQVLKSTKYVTVAICMENEPYLVSLSHGYDEDKNCLYFHCASEGKKMEFLKANSRVWGQALLDFGVTEECDYAYTSVHFSGIMSLIEDLREKQHGMEVLCGRFPLIQKQSWQRLSLRDLLLWQWAGSILTIFRVRSFRAPKTTNK